MGQSRANFSKREQFLPFAKPDMGDEEVNVVADVIRSGWLSTGPNTKKFEEAFANYLSVPQAIATSSCTASLHLALEAIGVSAGDEVITSTYTFASTGAVIQHLGAKPVLCDVEAVSLNIDTSKIEALITDRTKAIIPIHIAGQAADMDEVHRIAKQHGLKVIEDAAHALPSLYRGKLVGTLSDFTAFSFYATKNLAIGEGGMLLTATDEWTDHCRKMGLHGISKDAWKRYSSAGSWHYDIMAPGYKYNMTDIQAAIGMVQLRKLDGMTEHRQSIAATYDAAFADHPALDVPQILPDRSHCYHLYILRLNTDALRIDRNAFIQELRDLNIGTSVHFIPLHLHPHYRETFGYQPEDLPVAFGEYSRAISLPLYTAMTDEDVQYVIDAVTMIAEQNKA